MSDGVDLVLGATGLIGHGVAVALAAKGERVRALVRDAERARRSLPENVELAIGDVTRPETLGPAMRGVRRVYHAAGMPEQWQADEGIFDRVNREGTKNVLEAAHAAGVARVVYTSTMDVFAAPRGGTLREDNYDQHPKPTAYERSKQAAEREAEEIERRGLDVVYVNPASVYGPSPNTTALNAFFVKLLKKEVPVLPPGGVPLAYIDGVVHVHLAAGEIGVRGERYLVADEHLSMRDLSARILAAEGRGRKAPPVAPAFLLRLLAAVSAPIARTFGIAPLIAPGELSFLLWDIRVDASKAKRELAFEPMPADEGIRKTVDWLQGGPLRAPRK
jgi:dihydroflavonol-4-reductase